MTKDTADYVDKKVQDGKKWVEENTTKPEVAGGEDCSPIRNELK